MHITSLALLVLVAAPLAAQSTAFVGVTVLPMDRERTIPDQTVVVTDGRITAMGPTASTAVPNGARRIEARGKFLMPGLAEMHAHVPPQEPENQLLEDIMFLYVANGITTIRGMLGSPYQIGLRERLASGAMLGPRFYVGAPSLNGNSAPNPETAARLVREHKAAGYDLVKIHPGPSRATYDAAIATGREVGITLGGHVPADVGIAHAIASQQSTMDHLDGYIEGAAGPGAPGAAWREITTFQLRTYAEQTRSMGLYVVPTMFLWENLWWPPNPEEAATWPEMQYVPKPWVTGWQNQARGRANQVAQMGLTREDADVLFAKRNELLKHLADVEGTILMGTDSPQMFNVPGFALHRELRVMEQAGLTPWQVLVSGTRDVARYAENVLGQSAAYGTIVVGHEADLVLLDGDPLESLDNLTRRSGVMVRGRWLSKAELEAGLAEIAGRYAAGN